MPKSNAAKRAKKNLYARSNQAKPQGTRKRQRIMTGDQEKRDSWLLRDPITYTNPEDILYVAGNILLEVMAIRGSSVVQQLRRRGIHFNQVRNPSVNIFIHL